MLAPYWKCLNDGTPWLCVLTFHIQTNKRFRLYPQKYSELQPNILHAFTLPHKVIFGAIFEMVTWELLKIFAWELFIILWNNPNVLTETNYFCMKEYSALIHFLNQETTHHRLHNGTILKFLLMFPHNEFCMQKVASVTFIRFLKIHNFIIYHPNSK